MTTNRDRCVEMYKSGKRKDEIRTATGLRDSTIKNYISMSGLITERRGDTRPYNIPQSLRDDWDITVEWLKGRCGYVSNG